jgi:uncharacterized membrane protein YfcA
LAELLIVIAGAIAGGFISGLTGFGTGLTALPLWLFALPPPVAAPLVVICSTVAQIRTVPAIWHAVDMRRVAPFVAGGLLGAPVGTSLLPLVSAGSFKAAVGVLLVAYCGQLLLTRGRLHISWGGRLADAFVGVGGGICGGLAGLSGPLPTLWTGVRGWDKDQRRAVIQSFNLCVLGFALVTQAIAGLMTSNLARLVLVALPGTLLGAWLGRLAYDRLDTGRFDQVVLLVLLIAGVGMLVNVAAG